MKALQQLADLSWGKVLGIALGACVLYYFLLFNDGSDIDMGVQQAQAELKTEKDLLRKTEEKMKDLEAFREELNSQEAQVREVMSYLPKQINVSELLSMIQERASQAGMRVQRNDVDSNTKRVEFYESIRMTIETQGTFSQITTFLSLLSKLPRLVTIDGISITVPTSATPGKPSEPSKLKFKATIVGYRYVDETPATPGGANAPGR